MSRRASRQERGAVAVVVGISCVLLFSMAALAVDLGNAFVRKADTQSQADFAALAGGAQLAAFPPATTNPQAGDAAVLAAADYLFDNQPRTDSAAGPLTQAEIAANLVDGDPANGQAYYGHFNASGNLVPNTDELTIVTPPANVRFGFAGVMGFDDTDVEATATVGIYSPGAGPVPFFAVDGCDYGPQTIASPAAGHVADRNMSFPAASNNTGLDLLSPHEVAVGATGVLLDITGNNLNQVTRVGFFRSGDPIPGPPTYYEVTFGSPNVTANSILDIPIPNEVTAIEEVWWVRVYKNGAWSPVDEALPLTVGAAVFECVGGASDGNFGTLVFPRTLDTPSDWVPLNIATGLEEPLTVEALPTGADICTSLAHPYVRSQKAPPVPRQGTNCLETDTGLTSQDATAGFIEGIDDHLGVHQPGLLDADTTTTADGRACGADGTAARVDSGVHGIDINNDILTCFFTDATTTIDDIARPAYAGGAVLSEDIYKSPRFVWVPIFGTIPVSGGSQFYTIIDMRPGFITDQPLSADRTDNLVGTTDNGLVVANNRIEAIKVVFFNINALPNPSGGPVHAFMGVGDPVLRMTN